MTEGVLDSAILKSNSSPVKCNQENTNLKRNALLTITSLFSILLFTFHLTDDIVRGWEPGGLNNLIGGVLIMVVWLCATLVLAQRRSGYIVLLLGGLLSL